MKDTVAAPTDGFFAQLVANHCSDSIVITDAAGLTLWTNPAFVDMTGFSLDDMLGKAPGSLLQGKDTNRDTVRRIGRAIRSRQPFRGEILNYTSDGTPYWIDMSIRPIFDDEGNHTHFISVERDITERIELQQQAEDARALETHRSEERRLIGMTSEWLYTAKSMDELTKVVETAMQTIFPETEGQLYTYSNSRDVLDLACSWASNAPNKTLDASDCWALRRGRIYAYGTRAIEFPCDHVETSDAPYVCIPIVASGDTIGLLHMLFPQFAASDRARADLESYLDGRREIALLCAEQISLAVANVQLRQELQDQSTRDALTGLWNRRWFLETASKELSIANSNDGELSLISIDVDHFKLFNDHHGHDAGDMVLKEVSQVMQAHFATIGHCCRIGGEEFVIVVPGAGEDHALSLADALRVEISETELTYAGQKLPPLTVSAGVASFPNLGPELVTLIKAADQALYSAKEMGRNRVQATSAMG